MRFSNLHSIYSLTPRPSPVPVPVPAACQAAAGCRSPAIAGRSGAELICSFRPRLFLPAGPSPSRSWTGQAHLRAAAPIPSPPLAGQIDPLRLQAPASSASGQHACHPCLINSSSPGLRFHFSANDSVLKKLVKRTTSIHLRIQFHSPSSFFPPAFRERDLVLLSANCLGEGCLG